MRVVSEYLANLIASRVELRNVKDILNELRWLDEFTGDVAPCRFDLHNHLSKPDITASELRIWVRYGFSWELSQEGFSFWQRVCSVGLVVSNVKDDDCMDVALSWKHFIRDFTSHDHLQITICKYTANTIDDLVSS